MKKYIRDIEPITDIGIDFSSVNNINEVIEKIIEEPLQQPIKLLNSKGIKTVMSSANQKNLLKEGQQPKKKEDVKRETILFRFTYI